MTRFLVLFDRDLNDKAVESTDPRDHVYQLLRELRLDSGFNDPIAYIGAIDTCERIILTVVIDRPTPCWTSLREDLQRAFDEGAVEGNFNIVGIVEGAKSL